MKLIGLDIGDRRIGVAFGDTDLRLATPVDVIRRGTLEQDARAIALFVRQYDALQIVVGLPRNTDGTMGPQAESTRQYAEALARNLPIPVVFWDEHLTTVEATQRKHQAGARGKKARRALDAIAAAVILQDYMDSKGSGVGKDVP